MKKCHIKFTEHTRQGFHDGCWALDYNARRLYIYNHIERFEPKRRYILNDASKIQLSRNYWLPDETSPTKKQYVCKEMFLPTLGHKSNKVITTALLTTTDVGTNVGDKRG